MLGQGFTNGVSGANRRVFVYEVAGLSQSDATALSQVPIRSSDNQFFQVPYSRMNQEMQRILSLGGTIVNIQPLDSQRTEKKAPKAAEDAAKEDA